MLSSIKQRIDRDEDEGFTLIELMVVLLIIAIPTFLGARNTANARSTQENLRNALTAEQTNFTSTQSFTSNASSLEPSLTWDTVGPADLTSPGARAVNATVSGDTVVIQGLAKDGNCYAIYQSNGSDPSTNFTAYSAYKGTACATVTAPTAPPTTSMKGTPLTAAPAANGDWYTSW